MSKDHDPGHSRMPVVPTVVVFGALSLLSGCAPKSNVTAIDHSCTAGTTSSGPFSDGRLNECTLPDDVVSKAELEEKYRTHIHNLPDVLLHFRREFLNTRMMQSLAAFPEGSIHYVLVDDTYVNLDALTDDQKEGIPQLLLDVTKEQLTAFDEKARKAYEDVRATRISYHESLFKLHEEHLHSGAITDNEFMILKSLLEQLHRPYLEEPTQEDLRALLGGKMVGIETPDGQIMRVVYLPVRDGWLFAVQAEYEEQVRRIYQGSDNQVYIQLFESVFSMTSGLTLYPNPSQSYPDPEDIRERGANRGGYLIDSRTPGIRLRHENEHFYLIAETEADQAVLDELEIARKRFLNGDDSSYYIIFETSEGLTISMNESVQDQPGINSPWYKVKPRNPGDFRRRAKAKNTRKL